MRIRSLVVVVVLASAAFTCGRTEVVSYDFPTPTVDAGRDAGPMVDAGLAPFDAGTKPCLEGRFPLSPATPVVVLVLDKSGSMAERFGGPSTDTKWNALRDSLRQTLPAVNDTMELGLLLYPVSLNQSCSSFVRPNLDPALRQVPTIIQALDDALPAGGTPTADAIQTAANSLLDPPHGLERAGAGARHRRGAQLQPGAEPPRLHLQRDSALQRARLRR